MDERAIERAQDALCWQHPALARLFSRLTIEPIQESACAGSIQSGNPASTFSPESVCSAEHSGWNAFGTASGDSARGIGAHEGSYGEGARGGEHEGSHGENVRGGLNAFGTVSGDAASRENTCDTEQCAGSVQGEPHSNSILATDGRRILFSPNAETASRGEVTLNAEGIRDSAQGAEPVQSSVSSADAPFSFATDGRRILFSPSAIEPSPEQLRRILIHMVAHCLLGHPWARAESDLVCDAQAWLLSEEIAPETALSGAAQEFRRRLKGAETLAETQEILKTDPFFQQHESEFRALIALDSHALWGISPPETRAVWASGGFQAHQRGKSGTAAGNQTLEWRPARADADALAEYLSRYAVLRENAREDPDDFQPAWYLYGLEHYGNIPLIEPSESREEKRLETLAIVIDTSGSCARGLTQSFLALLCGLLEESGLFFQRFNLRVIQCDARVQRDDAIGDLRAFRRYIETLELRGGGGTDFRPAFERIDALIASGALRGLKGALFFSDGRGIFPSKPPKYETTFVFLKHRFDAIDVPEWVRRLVIEAPMPVGGEYIEY